MLREGERKAQDAGGSPRRHSPPHFAYEASLIERERELGDLAALVEAARTGEGTIALITGEAGIGKTTLIDAFRSLFGADMKVLAGGNDPLTTPRPYGPIFDMAPSFSPSLAKLLHADAPRAQLFDALYAELAQASPPPAMIIEDAHWADYATLDFLKFIGRRISAFRGVILLSYRDDEVGVDHPLSVVLGEFPQARVRRLPLAPFSREGVLQLAGGRSGGIDAFYDVTNGNPFFVTEMLGDSDARPASLPASIQDAVSARLARLPETERAFLETLSVTPKAVSEALIRKVFGDDAVETALTCLGKGLLVENEDGDFRFRHELARLATLERLRPDRRRRAHRQFYEALSLMNDPASIDLQVHHADGAKMADEVLRVAPLAATKASALGAHGEAFAHLSVALKYIDNAPPEIAAPIWEQWAGSACVSTSMGDDIIDGRSEAARLWTMLNRPEKAAENLRWRSRLHWYRCEPEPANSVAMEAIDLLEGTGRDAETALAASLRAQLSMLKLEMDDAVRWGARAIELARRCSAMEAEVHALNSIGAAKCFQNDPEGLDYLRKSLALADSASYGEYAAHDGDIARAFLNMADHCAEFRKFDAADAIISEGVKRCTEIDFEAWVYQLHGRRAQIFLDQGKIEDARKIAKSVFQYGAITPQIKLTPSLVLAKIATRCGESDAVTRLNDCLDRACSAAETGHEIAVRLAFIEFAWLNGDDALAERHLDALAALDAKNFHIWNEGERHVWEKRIRNRTFTARKDLPVCFATELAGDSRQAANVRIAAGLPYDAALCLLRNADAATSEMLAEAARLLEPTGAAAALDKCRSLAQNFGVEAVLPARKRGPYHSARSHPLGLTKRESEVLSFVAEGATNREISEKLRRSPRTIDQHVSAVLKKLNVSTRIEAILRVTNEPWILQSGGE